MEPAQPDPPEATPVPVGGDNVPAANVPAEAPVEAQTLAFRPGALKRPAPEEKAVPPPANAPQTTNVANDSTVAFNKVAQARGGMPTPPIAPAEPEPDFTQGGTVSIHQVKRMRSLLEAPAPAVPDYPPGTTTVPIRRSAGSQVVPESAPPAPEPDPPALVEAPIRPRPSAPGAIRPRPEADPPAKVEAPIRARPSAPGAIRPRPSAPGTAKPPSEPAPAVELDPKLLCPRCQAKLISPENLGMCPSCGYCRSLEEGKDKIPPPKRKSLSLFGLVEFCQLLGMVPLWSWILLGGIAAVILGTIYVPRYLTAAGPQRAWWGTTQFILGLVIMAVAQGWALFQVAAHDDRVGLWDLLLLSGRVWRLVLDRLPRTQAPLWMACWGCTLTVSALFLTGMPFSGTTASQQGVFAELRGALDAMNPGDYQALQSAAREDVKATADAPAPPEREGDDPRPSKPCAVIGYTRDAEGKPNGLIVAAPENGRLQYAGIVRAGLRKSREVLERLGALEKVDGPIEGGAVWVKPELSVDVHHSGSGANGTLNDPNLGGVIAPE